MFLTFGSLFAGLGAADYGLERAGMVCRFQVEVDEFCCKVLRKHWPDVKRYGNIQDIDWELVEGVDVLVGGFPCQTVSLAGKRMGTEDERWLWPEFARAIRSLRPRYVIVENVPGLLVPIRRDGRIIAEAPMGEVLGDLAACGYNAEWQVLSAAQFGASHLRERVFILAYPKAFHVARPIIKGNSQGQSETASGNGGVSQTQSTNATKQRYTWPQLQSNATQQGQQASAQRAFPSYSDWWLLEPDVGRVAVRTSVGMDRLRILGNAIVPQCMEHIGRCIIDCEQTSAH